MAGLGRLLEFESKLKVAAGMLDEAETLINAMLITGEYRYIKTVKELISKALREVEEAERIARELTEEVDKALGGFEEED
jgi:histidinol dehydrogenase